MNLLMQQNHQKKPPLRLITERHAPSPQGRFMRKQNVLDCPEVDDEASDPKLLHCYCYWLPYLLLVTFPSPFTQSKHTHTHKFSEESRIGVFQSSKTMNSILRYLIYSALASLRSVFRSRRYFWCCKKLILLHR